MQSSQFQIGDKVAVLDDAIEGEVEGVDGNEITIATSEGFTMKFYAKELIVTSKNESLKNLFSNVSVSKVLAEKQEPTKRSFVKEKKSKKDDFAVEFDLHIDKLVNSTKGMTNYDMLTIQLDSAKGKLEFAIRNRIPKIVFIHGVGEGILKAELETLLRRYDKIVFNEAKFQKYGSGATEVFIKQN